MTLKDRFEVLIHDDRFKKTALYAGIGGVAIAAFPYVLAGAGLALGFWLGRKGVGQIEPKM